MLKPEHVTASELASQRRSTRRTISVVGVGALHLLLIWALASGLATNMVAHITEDVKVAVIKEKMDVAKPPPPPPPDFKVPPPDFVPPPEINIQTEAPQTNAITTVQKVAPAPVAPPPPAPPKPQGATAPVLSAGATNCASNYYPPTAVRLNQEGETLVTIHVGTNGQVSNVDISGSSGFSSLDDAAVKCIMARWHFKPAMENGTPVAGTKQFKIQWKLK